MKTLHIEVDEELIGGLNKSLGEFERDIRLAAAVKMYEMETLSQSKAAQLAGLSRSEFIMALSAFQVSPVQETVEDIIDAIQSR